jgi:hypothetical protein
MVGGVYIRLSCCFFSYCGQWVASPALGSAGPTLKIVAYAIAIPGLIAGGESVWHSSRGPRRMYRDG